MQTKQTLIDEIDKQIISRESEIEKLREKKILLQKIADAGI